jgi:hypothetical protein
MTCSKIHWVLLLSEAICRDCWAWGRAWYAWTKDGQIHYNISDKFYQDPNDKVLGGEALHYLLHKMSRNFCCSLGTREYPSGAKTAYIVSVFLRGKAFVTDQSSNFTFAQLHFLWLAKKKWRWWDVRDLPHGMHLSQASHPGRAVGSTTGWLQLCRSQSKGGVQIHLSGLEISPFKAKSSNLKRHRLKVPEPSTGIQSPKVQRC